MINVVTASTSISLENIGFQVTGFTRGVRVYNTFEPREAADLTVFVGYSTARSCGAHPASPYEMSVDRPGVGGVVIPRVPVDGSVEQLLTRRAIWAVKMPSLYDMPFGEFYGDTITTPDGSRGSSPLSGTGLACVQWLTRALGRYPSLDEQAAAVASWEVARHNRIRARTNGWTDFHPALFATMAQARRTAADLGITLTKVAKERAPSRWHVTTAEAMIPILLGGE